MSSFENKVYVRFCETDATGYINNTSHLLYFEEARMKFFNEVYPEKSSDFSFLVASVNCDYLTLCKAVPKLKIQTVVSRIGTKSFTISQDLLKEESEPLVARTEVVLVCFNKLEQLSIPIPYPMLRKLKQYRY